MRVTLVLAAAAFAVACGRHDDADRDTTSAAATTGASAAGMVGAGDNADQQFLTKMSDHHEGLVTMATAAMTKASKSQTQGDAHMLHTKQAAERDSMVAMLRSQYNSSHTPMAMEKNRAQNDSLQRLTGAEYDRTFYRLVIDHHREGIAMIDSIAPRLTNGDVKQMAEKMKADQTKEIADFQRKAGS